MIYDHDSLFRYTFEQPEHTASLLRTILPAPLASAIDWGSLRMQPGTSVDEHLQSRHADLLFSAQIGREPVLIYLLLEHKSESDRWTALQLLRYVVRAFDRYLVQHPDAVAVPPIVPIVVHHGVRAFHAPRTVLDLIDLGALPPSVHKILSPLQPNLHFLLDDLAAMPESAMKQRHATVQTRLTLLLLQFVRQAEDREPAQFVLRWRDLMQALWNDPAGRPALISLFSYLAATAETPTEGLATAAALIHEDARTMGKTIADQFRNEGFQKAMSIADRRREEDFRKGVDEGVAEGKAELLLRLAIVKFGAVADHVEARIRRADQGTLDRWAERLLTAPTIDDVLA